MDSKQYLTWFKKLLNLLNEPHIIVMDNCPFHSIIDAPSSTDKKAVLLEWLKTKTPTTDHAYLDTLRRYELWPLVLRRKSKDDCDVLHQLAFAKGHKILRLPPYTPQLNAIENLMIKHY